MKKMLGIGERVNIRQMRGLKHHQQGYIYIDEQQKMVYRIINGEVVGVYGDLEFAELAEQQYHAMAQRLVGE